MEASKEIFDKVSEYQKLKSEAKKLRSEIKDLLEKEYLEKTGFTLGVGTFEPFISDSSCIEATEIPGVYCQETPVGHKRSSKYWYIGTEFVAVENSDKFIGFDYKR